MTPVITTSPNHPVCISGASTTTVSSIDLASQTTAVDAEATRPESVNNEDEEKTVTSGDEEKSNNSADEDKSANNSPVRLDSSETELVTVNPKDKPM